MLANTLGGFDWSCTAVGTIGLLTPIGSGLLLYGTIVTGDASIVTADDDKSTEVGIN